MTTGSAIGSAVGYAVGAAVAGGGVGPELPPDAIGVWYASDYVSSPRPYIPNAVSGSTTTPRNILSMGRRWFSGSIGYDSNLATITQTGIADQNGTSDASRVVGSSGDWYVNFTVNSLPAGTYKFGVWAKSHDGSMQTVRFGNNASMASDTVNGTWKRLSQTIVWGGGNLALIIIRNSGSAAGDVDICDAGLFAGSTDYGAGVADSVPVGHMMMGKTAYDDLPTSVSGGVLNLTAGTAAIQLSQAVSVTDFTAMCVAAKTGSATVTHSFLSKIQDYDDFSMSCEEGPNGSPSDPYLGNDHLNSGNYPGLWVPRSDEWRTIAIRKESGTLSIFLNGILFYSVADASVSVSIADLVCGWLLNSGIHGKYKFNSIALWDRALSTAEVVTADAFLSAKAAESELDTSIDRYVLAEGDSITYGTGSSDGLGSYANRAGANLTGTLGLVTAVAGAALGTPADSSSVNSLYGRKARDLSVIPTNKNGRTFILTILIGRNDLLGYSGGATQYAANVATYAAAMKAGGFDKVAICTVLPSTLAGFNTQRNLLNAIYTGAGWAAANNIDAIIDLASVPGMGADSDASNPANYGDGTHPTNAGYILLQPTYAAGVNGL